MEEQGQPAIDTVLGIGPTIDSMTGKPLPSPSSVSVSVVNGTGVTNQATDTSAALGALGFKMVGLGDATPVAPQRKPSSTTARGPLLSRRQPSEWPGR